MKTALHLLVQFPDFLNMVPIVVYSQVLHEGIPMLAQPARNKQNLHVMFGGALTFACECNLSSKVSQGHVQAKVAKFRI